MRLVILEHLYVFVSTFLRGKTRLSAGRTRVPAGRSERILVLILVQIPVFLCSRWRQFWDRRPTAYREVKKCMHYRQNSHLLMVNAECFRMEINANVAKKKGQRMPMLREQMEPADLQQEYRAKPAELKVK